MFEGTNFGKTVGLLHRSMGVASLRRRVIADNMANSGVPNFKRSDLNFEASLKRALDSEGYEPPIALRTRNDRHIPLFRPTDWRSIEPRRVLDYLSTSKNNGNNVDPEHELMDSLTNQLAYTMQAQALNHEFNQVNIALRSS